MTRTLIVAGIFMLATVVARAGVDDTRVQVRRVLQERCFACHGVLKQESGLRVDTAASAITGGEGGAAIVPGDSSASELVRRISAVDLAERMPPEGDALKPNEIVVIRRWIDQGATAPDDEQPESDPREHWAFKTPVRPEVPAVEVGKGIRGEGAGAEVLQRQGERGLSVENAAWVRNPIDAFIAATYQQQGLRPQPQADKRIWLRRVSMDLIGLPPTREEQEQFLADDSSVAVDRVVTRLLDSPRYGERWGRHWMDIWRYSDWWGLGAEVRNSQKHIWHWRDWIIESLNADKGYDQMLREMLAADELYPNDLERLRATGFLARQYFKFNRTSWLDEAVEHTSKAILGLTVNCAKCHNHKYDPVSQVEYYQMRAFFEPYQIRTDALPGELDFEKDGLPRAFDCNLNVPTYLHIRGDERNPDLNRKITPIVPAFLAFREFPIQPVALSSDSYQPGLRAHVMDNYRNAASAKIRDARAAVDSARTQLGAPVPGALLPQTLFDVAAPVSATDLVAPPLDEAQHGLAIAEKSLQHAERELDSVNARAAADQARNSASEATEISPLIAAAVRAERLAAVAKAEVVVATAELTLLKATSEKRVESEKAVIDARAALEAIRLAIEMPGDSYTSLAGALKTLESNLETEESRRKPFPSTSTGRRSALASWITDPQHPLPARVAVNHLWSRHFGTAIVPTLFDFGRKGAKPSHPELLDWLAIEFIESGWSMKHIHRLIVTSATYRMTSSSLNSPESNRKADPDNRAFWRMNPMRMEAQVVRDSLLHLAGALDFTMSGPSIPVSDLTSCRRSLYFVHSHNEHQTFLSIFDDASVLECYRRSESIVPQQALALENSALASEMAGKIATSIVLSDPSMQDEPFIVAAFRLVLCTDPTLPEAAAALQALSAFRSAADSTDRPAANVAARSLLIQALLNHNDFVTIR